jgi:hypothetical protein
MKSVPAKPTPTQTLDDARNYRSEVAVTSMDLFNGPGIITGFLIRNNTATQTEIHFWDALEVPADGAVPHFPPITLPASAAIALDFGKDGLPVAIGACVSISSTVGTTTLSANAAFININARR